MLRQLNPDVSSVKVTQIASFKPGSPAALVARRLGMPEPGSSPAAEGYAWPAEWEEQSCCYLGWPDL